MELKKVFLSEAEMPRQWYNIMADMPTPMEPPPAPGDRPAGRPPGSGPYFPYEFDRARGQQSTLDRHPGTGVGKIHDVASFPPGAGLCP